MPKDYDFCGWATKNDLRCSDGRVIRHGAFSVNDGKKVPLVWNHQHNSPEYTLGHAILQNKDEGVYAYCYFNDGRRAEDAKAAVKHGDVESLSIWANNLQQEGSNVIHGVIREVSLVLAGANPGAFIESVLAHSEPMEDGDDEGIFYTNEGISLFHAEEKKEEKEVPSQEEKKSEGKTVQEVFDTLNEEQKTAVAIIVGQAIADSKGEEKKEDEEEMKHHIFEEDGSNVGSYLAHSIDMEELLKDAKRQGSLKAAVEDRIKNEDDSLAHAIDTTGMVTASGSQTYGFNDPDMLFPDFRTLQNTPEWLSRNMDWVQKVMSGVHHTPFSRIKSVYADITEDDARARGYMKGKLKKEEVFSLLKRTTDPQTVYKKQKMDRDDIIDITDFDVVAWIKAEIRVMLNEEIARAILIGDGRLSSSDDKIKEDHVRPIVNDAPLFNTKIDVPAGEEAAGDVLAKAIINAAVRSRKNYKGSGNPTFFTTEDYLTEMLLLEDGIGHKLYKTEAELATALRVKEIVTVEVMEGVQVDEKDLIGVIVNMADYNVGADKGGEVNMFEDFDIDYNQEKYLIETRISGALIKPYSAITLLRAKN